LVALVEVLVKETSKPLAVCVAAAVGLVFTVTTVAAEAPVPLHASALVTVTI
jgi:hypothetical protein